MVALAGKGVLAIWNGIAEAAESDFVAWHIREHIPERVAVPGFLRGRRYVAVAGHPKYFNFYETETVEALHSQVYLAKLNAPSEWTTRVVRHFRDTSRTACTVSVSLGRGDGAYLCAVRLTGHAAAGVLSRQVAATVMAPLLATPGIVAAHLLEGRPGTTGGQTAETALRDEPDQSAAWILLIDAADRGTLERAVADHASQAALLAAGAGYEPGDLGIYRLQYALSREQLL